MNRGHDRNSYDNVCSFYIRIGACRHGEKCVKKHIKPAKSDTVLLSNLYQNPELNKNEEDLNPKQIQEHFENFYKDIFIKFSQIDEVKDLIVCENVNNHLNGNIYVKFKSTAGAQQAVFTLNQEWYGRRPVHCELSPVKSFQDANCRAHEAGTCDRDFCNFMHIKRPPEELKSMLFKGQEKTILIRRVEELKHMVAQKHESEERPQETTPTPGNGDFKSTFESLFKAS